MVLKHKIFFILQTDRFENDVEMYGAQTCVVIIGCKNLFENDVEMYGAQTFGRLY